MKKLFKIDPMFKKIFNINLLYANPMYVDKVMKKGKYGVNTDKLYKDILFKNHILGSVLMLLIYFVFFLPIDFKKAPHMFDVSIGLFLLMNIFQTFTYFYNVFFESKDIESYMSLPIEESLVFKAKMSVVSIATMQLLTPVIAVSFSFSFRGGYNLGFAAIFAILDFFVLGAITVVVNCFIMNILLKSALISRFKNKIITAITVLTNIISVGFIVAIQYYSKMMALAEGHYGPISYISKNIGGHIIMLVVVLLVLFLIYKLFISKIANNFYDYVRKISANDLNSTKSSKKIKKKKTNRSKKNIGKGSIVGNLFRYNFSLIDDSTIISQTFASIFIPIIIMIPSLTSINKYSAGLVEKNRIVIGISYAVVIALMGNCYSTGLSGVIYSLDGYNYDYIKSLPISEKTYFVIKTIFSSGVNAIFGVLIYIGLCIYFKLGILAAVAGIVIEIILYIGLGSQWVRYDYENRVKDWQSTSEIYNRSNKLLSFTVAFIGIVITMMYMWGMLAIIDMGHGRLVIFFSALISIIVIIISYTRTLDFIRKLD